MNTFARNWWRRAKHETQDIDFGDPGAIAQEYGVSVEEVETVIQFISRHSSQRVENFKFLLEQLTQ